MNGEKKFLRSYICHNCRLCVLSASSVVKCLRRRNNDKRFINVNFRERG